MAGDQKYFFLNMISAGVHGGSPKANHLAWLELDNWDFSMNQTADPNVKGGRPSKTSATGRFGFSIVHNGPYLFSLAARGKPRAGFPLFPRAPWESHQKQARFPHSHSSGDEGGWESGKPKAGFPLSQRPEYIYVRKQTTRPRAGFAPRPAAGAPRRLRVKE